MLQSSLNRYKRLKSLPTSVGVSFISVVNPTLNWDAPPMQYTVRQLRETVGLSKETYRHWKKVLKPIADRGGRAPCFNIGDLIAASVIYRLTEIGGIRVGQLSDLATIIFDLCNSTPWASLENSTLTIDLNHSKCYIQPDATSACDLALVCQLNPVLEALRSSLLQTKADTQQSKLRFPPTTFVEPSDKRRRQA